jgi:flagellar hook-basal body complex protein FliE
MATPLTAASTYANIARMAGEAQRALLPPAGTAPKSETSFASVLKDAIASVNEIGHKSDVQTRAAAAGKSNMVDVVTAVAETEVAIDAVVAVRDKVIAAYDEIMKMPI